MRGRNQHTKFESVIKLNRRIIVPEKSEVDGLVENILNTPLEDNDGKDLLSVPDQFVPKQGNESALSLRRRLTREYDSDNPVIQLLINAVVRLYHLQRKATSADGLLKIVNGIRGCIQTLETITGKGRTRGTEIPNPEPFLTDEQRLKETREFELILGLNMPMRDGLPNPNYVPNKYDDAFFKKESGGNATEDDK